MPLFKRILPEAEDERRRGDATALIFLYFWFAGILLFCAALYAVYERITGTEPLSIFHIVSVLVVSIIYMAGAREIGRFNRNGVVIIAMGMVLGSVGWLLGKPKLSDLTFTAITAIALIVAWQDLSSDPPQPKSKHFKPAQR